MSLGKKTSGTNFVKDIDLNQVDGYPIGKPKVSTPARKLVGPVSNVYK